MESNEQESESNVPTNNSDNQLDLKQDNRSTLYLFLYSMIKNWKLLLGLLISLLLATIFFWFYAQHFVAVRSMNTWAKDVQGEPVNCVFRDTDGNGYISCTAKVNEQLVPLECGTNIFNMGCRVNYGGSLSVPGKSR